MKTRIQILLALCILVVTILALGGAVSARPLAAPGDVGILDNYCDCCASARAALGPADRGEEVDMAVVHSRRFRAAQAALAAEEIIGHVDVAQLRAERDQAIQAVTDAVAAADEGAEVDMAVLASRRYHAEQLTHAVIGAEMTLAHAAHHM
jgi:hypothetical protein